MRSIEKIEVTRGDITKIKIDAIVNAANTSLLGGGGVDGAIHRAGGKAILEECMKIRDRQGGCKVGEAVITTAGDLPAKYVIHTVGPVWNGGHKREEELLAKAYLNSLRLTIDRDISEIAFPGISTGIYRFPKDKAAVIALSTVLDFLEANDRLRKVVFVTFDSIDFDIYDKLIHERR